MLHLRNLLLCSAIGSLSIGQVHAQEQGATVGVHVRAESRIDLEWIVVDDVQVLQGRLQDDLGHPLTNRSLTLELTTDASSPLKQMVTTDEHGEFWLDRPDRFSDDTRIEVEAKFSGDENYDASYVTLRADTNTRKPTLDVHIGDPVDLAQDTTKLSLRLQFEGMPAKAQVTVRNELGHEVASIDLDGEQTVNLPTHNLGPPGDGRLIAETEETAQWASRRTELPIRRRIRPTLTLSMHGNQEACGTLADRFGKLPDRIIEVRRSEQRLATLQTDSDGRYCIPLPASTDDAHALVASFAGDGRGRWPATSAPLPLRTTSSGSQRYAWLGALLTMALGLFAWLMLGKRKEPAHVGQPTARPRIAGVQPSDVSRARTADQTHFGLTVLALESGQPLAGAIVQLKGRSVNHTHTLRSDQDGRVELETLEHGTWEMRIASEPGYVAEGADVTSPHRGQWHDARVYLRSIRQHADAVWTSLATELSGKDVQHLTQREISSALPELFGANVLAQDVETTTYGKEDRDVRHLESLKAQAAHLKSASGAAKKPPQVPEK